MQTKNVKEEIIDFLLNGYSTASNSNIEDSPTIRYCKSLDLLLTKENSAAKNEFLKLYCDLIQKKDFPVFKVYTAVLIYKKWLYSPLIINHLTFIGKKLKAQFLDDEFWVQLIVSIEISNVSKSLQKARLNLLVLMINSKMFTHEELLLRGDVINSILRIYINLENQEKLINGLKNNKHPYFRMLYIIRRLINRNYSKLELAEIIKIHFFSPDNELPWNETTKNFQDCLEAKLPIDYLLSINKLELRKLYYIYKVRPSLFDQLIVEDEKPLTFKSILTNLFSDFMISGVFVKSFYTDKLDLSESEWFFDEIRGENIVYSKTLPFKLTKKAAHHFRNLPYDFNITVSEGLVYSSLFIETNDHHYAYAAARAIRDVYHADYWIKTMSLLHRQGLTTNNVPTVMDYIHEKVFIEGVELGLKNKSIQNLIDDMNEWHLQLRTARELKLIRSRRLADAGLDDFKMELDKKIYIIKQLRSSIELFDEGNDLCHCVYSYRNDCWKGNSYIFSLRELDEQETEKRLITIELKDDRVCQARGKYNCNPSQIQKEIISTWADDHNFSFYLH